MNRFALAALVLFSFGGAAVVEACSSSSGAPLASCLSAPLSCAPGETCWPFDTAPTFTCQASANVGFGAACEDTFGAPTCGDKMACDEPSAGNGHCTLYCDSVNTCPAGYDCHVTQVGSGDSGATLQICRREADDSGAIGIDNGTDGAVDTTPVDAGAPSFDANFDAPIIQR